MHLFFSSSIATGRLRFRNSLSLSLSDRYGLLRDQTGYMQSVSLNVLSPWRRTEEQEAELLSVSGGHICLFTVNAAHL